MQSSRCLNKCVCVFLSVFIVSMCRSNKEGSYPGLMQFAEDRLTELNPKRLSVDYYAPISTQADI